MSSFIDHRSLEGEHTEHGMNFERAVDDFREFLRKQGYVGPLKWIAPAHVAFWFGELLIRPSSDGEAHAEQVFDRGYQRGFGVALEAIAKLGHSICCFVFAPDDADDAGDHFVAPPITMKVRQDRTRSQDRIVLGEPTRTDMPSRQEILESSESRRAKLPQTSFQK